MIVIRGPVLLVAILSLLSATPAAAQPKDWPAQQDLALLGCRNWGRACEEQLRVGNWAEARRKLAAMSARLEQLKTDGFEDDLRVVKLTAEHALLRHWLSSKRTTPPVSAGRAKRIRYVRQAGGTRRGGQTATVPARSLWGVLAGSRPGDEIRLHGPLHGKPRVRVTEGRTKRLSLSGGWDRNFDVRDPVATPTVLAVDQKRGPSGHVLRLSGIDSAVIDGLVIDQRGQNAYDAKGDLVPARSHRAPTLSVSFRKTLVISNCVFVNGLLGGLIVRGLAPGATATIENCVFLNCSRRGLFVSGKGARFIVRDCTFALTHPLDGRGGAAIELGAEGRLEAQRNVFAYGRAALASFAGNRRIRLTGNLAHALTDAFLLTGTTDRPMRSALDAKDLPVESAEGNRTADPGLQLARTPLLRFLRGTDAGRLDPDLRDRELLRLSARPAPRKPPAPKPPAPKVAAPAPSSHTHTGSAQPHSHGKKEPAPKPHAHGAPRGPGLPRPVRAAPPPPQPPTPPRPAPLALPPGARWGADIPAGAYRARAYVRGDGAFWVFPAADCKAGARRPTPSR